MFVFDFHGFHPENLCYIFGNLICCFDLHYSVVENPERKQTVGGINEPKRWKLTLSCARNHENITREEYKYYVLSDYDNSEGFSDRKIATFWNYGISN